MLHEALQFLPINQMILNTTSEKVTIELTRHELHLANALIQEGRISHRCDSPEG